MNKKACFLASLLLMLSFVVSGCMGLIPLQQEPATSQFGPTASLQEQQTKTFEVLWKDFQDNYIYFDSANVDWKALHDKYAGRIKAGLTTEQFTTLIEKDLAADLPKGSLLYQSRTERIQADTADTSTYEGIGAFVGFSEDPKPHIILLAVIDGSPAQKAGLKAHDSIFDIDGSPVQLEEGLGAVNRVRGPAGSSVTLGVQSPGSAERSVKVQRGKLTSTGKLEAVTIEGTNYGYILFPPAGDTTLVQDVTQSLQSFTSNKKLNGLILDLRIANSTNGWPLQDVAALFFDGTLGQFYNRNQKQPIQVTGQDVNNSQKVPLVILVGQNTTGSPEIFAAGLQAQKRATLIGEATPGSVEANSSFYLPDGSQAFIETISFALPSGGEVGNTGVVPDIAVAGSWDQILPNDDPVLDRAVKFLDTHK